MAHQNRYQSRQKHRPDAFLDDAPATFHGDAKEQATQAVAADLQALVAAGLAERFDDRFYAQFAGQEFQGRPVIEHLRDQNLGRCFDCSALLGLALGGKDADDWQICEGELARLNPAFKMQFRHGWLEHGNWVYDTTWHARIDRDAYYDLFDAHLLSVTATKDYFGPQGPGAHWAITPTQERTRL